MVVEKNGPKEEKPGLLSAGFNVGDSVPLLDEAGIPSRVTEKGTVEWQPTPITILEIINKADVVTYFSHRKDQVLHSLFRGLDAFIKAILGFPVGLNASGWPIEQLPIPQPIPLWQEAPQKIESMVFESAREYLRHQTADSLS